MPAQDDIGYNQPYWQNKDSESEKVILQALDQNVECDVCVVGLGASGLTAAIELRNRNISVVAIDTDDVGAGAAGRNGGFMLAGTDEYYHDNVQTYGREQAKREYLETVAELDYQFQTYPESCYRTGSLRVAQDQDELDGCRECFEEMIKDNLQIEWYKGEHGEGYYCPSDGKFNPLLRCRILAKEALQKGASLFCKTKADSVEGTEVKTDRGFIIKCKKVIVAVDGQLENILPELKERDVRTCRLQMVATEPATDINLPMPIHRMDDYWLQMPDGCIALGGFRELTEDTEWTLDDTPDEPIQSWLDDFLKTRVGTNAKVTHRWGGLVTYSPNGPIKEELRPGVFAIGCYNGTGNIMGTLFAKKAAQWAADSLQ